MNQSLSFRSVLAAVLLVVVCLLARPALAAIGDMWALNLNGSDVVRVDSNGNLITNKQLLKRGLSADNRVATATNYSTTGSENIVAVSSTAAARGIYLPDVTTLPSGTVTEILDESGGAATHNIIIYPYTSQTINGSTSAQTISSNYGHLTLYGNGSAWFIK